jgi:hypothetical protein
MRTVALGFALLVVHCGARSSLLGGAGSNGGGATGGAPSERDGGAAGAPLEDGAADAPIPLDGSPTDGCGDTQSSPHDCGACGHDCEGGACVNGVCQPFLLTNDESFPKSLAVDDTTLYWANGTDADYGSPPASIVIRSMPKSGGTPATLYTLEPGTPTSLHHADKNLYVYRSIEWTIPGQPYVGSIVKMCDDGVCPVQNLTGDVDNYKWEIALDDNRIYFPTAFNGGASAIVKSGGAATQVVEYASYYFKRLSVDDTDLYAYVVPNPSVAPSDPVKLLRADKTTLSAPTELMSGLVEGGDVAVDAENVFVSDTKAVHRLAKTGPTALVPTTITPPGVAPGFMASDADRVYWLESPSASSMNPSTLHWARKDGGGASSMTLANVATLPVPPITDDTSIYWVVTLAPLTPPTPAKGGIMKVRKPLL